MWWDVCVVHLWCVAVCILLWYVIFSCIYPIIQTLSCILLDFWPNYLFFIIPFHISQISAQVRAMFWLCYDHVITKLWGSYDHVGNKLVISWEQVGPSCNQFMIKLGLSWYHYRTKLGPSWYWVGIKLGPVWDPVVTNHSPLNCISQF